MSKHTNILATAHVIKKYFKIKMSFSTKNLIARYKSRNFKKKNDFIVVANKPFQYNLLE